MKITRLCSLFSTLLPVEDRVHPTNHASGGAKQGDSSSLPTTDYRIEQQGVQQCFIFRDRDKSRKIRKTPRCIVPIPLHDATVNTQPELLTARLPARGCASQAHTHNPIHQNSTAGEVRRNVFPLITIKCGVGLQQSYQQHLCLPCLSRSAILLGDLALAPTV